MSACDFTACNKSEPGGCPCAAVRANRGPLTARECAEVLGVELGRIRSIEAMAIAKVRALPPCLRARWESLLGDWPRRPETHWDGIDRMAPYLGEGEAKKMNAQMQRRWKELGWT